MPRHPSSNSRLSSLAQAHRALKRQHRQLADSFKERSAAVTLDLQVSPGPHIIDLTAAQNYQWAQPLSTFFYVTPEEAEVTYVIDTPTANFPADFTARVVGTGTPQSAFISAATAFSGAVDVQITGTARYKGQEATATTTLRFTVDNPQVRLRIPSVRQTVALTAPLYSRAVDLANLYTVDPNTATVTYDIETEPTDPNLTARISGNFLELANPAPNGWTGNAFLKVTITATHLGFSDTRTMDFFVTTTRAAPSLTISATAGVVLGTLTDAATDTYTSPLPLSSYFNVASTAGTPALRFSASEPAPLTTSITEASLPGAAATAFYLTVESAQAFAGTRDVIVTGTASLGADTATATKTFRLSSPVAVAAPTIRTTRPRRPVTLGPDNNWRVVESLLTTSAGGVPTDPIFQPVGARPTFFLTSGQTTSATSQPKVRVRNDPVRTPTIEIWSDSSQAFSSWRTARNVVVRAQVSSGGQVANTDITFPVSYASLSARANPTIPRQSIVRARANTIDVRAFISASTGTSAAPSYSLRSRRFSTGGQNITLSSSGTVLTLTPSAGATVGSVHTVSASVDVSYEGQRIPLELAIPVQVVSVVPVITLTPDDTSAFIKRTASTIVIILSANNNFIFAGPLPPASSLYFDVTPASSVAQFSLGEQPPPQLNVGSPLQTGGAIAGTLVISSTASQGPGWFDFPGGFSGVQQLLATYGITDTLTWSAGTFTLNVTATNEGLSDSETIRFYVLVNKPPATE